MAPLKLQCFQDGEKLGEKTAQEWADQLGLNVQTIRHGKCAGHNVRGSDGKRYKFCAGPKEVKPKNPPQKKTITLSDIDAICKAEGKRYGTVQTEITNGRVITQKDVAKAKKKIGRQKNAECSALKDGPCLKVRVAK